MGIVARAALILDLDGTVWDSRAWYDALVSLVRPGSSAGSNAANALKRAGCTRARFKAICRAGEPSLVCFPGLYETLGSLSAKEVRLGVVTNLPSWMALPMLQAVGLDQLLAVVVTWGETKRHKPYPDPLLCAVEQLASNPARSWYIGDESSDEAAAAAAGINFAWAAWGYAAGFETNGCVLRSVSDVELLLGLAS